MEQDRLIELVLSRAGNAPRFVVAIAGAPGSGKSTLAASAAEALRRRGESTAVVPMDGFHYDDAVLHALDLADRKGAPETFDFAGFRVLLQRIRASGADVAIPLFDRAMELSRAAAAIVEADTRLILVEGNYLLLDEEPWRELADLFDLTIYLDVPRAELERRLLERWHSHGRDPVAARRWVEANDMPNAERVICRRRKADIVV